jgi:hypothetical protein
MCRSNACQPMDITYIWPIDILQTQYLVNTPENLSYGQQFPLYNVRVSIKCLSVNRYYKYLADRHMSDTMFHKSS